MRQEMMTANDVMLRKKAELRIKEGKSKCHTCFMWCGALDSSGFLLSYSIIFLSNLQHSI